MFRIGRLYVELEFIPQDFWVGMFWRRIMCSTDEGPQPLATDIWLCLVPCLPIHLTYWHDVRINFSPDPDATE
jgi:hypothetical protein